MDTGELLLADPQKRRGTSPAMEVLLEVSMRGEPPVVCKESVTAPLLSLWEIKITRVCRYIDYKVYRYTKYAGIGMHSTFGTQEGVQISI